MGSGQKLKLVAAIKAYLEAVVDESPGVGEVLSQINTLTLDPGRMIHRRPVPPAHSKLLDVAIAGIPGGRLAGIAEALPAVVDLVEWRMDRGRFYEDPREIGDDYTNGNMNCELIGPEGNAFHHPDFTLGLFFMVPRILYRDHDHIPPELYLPLNGPHGWRFDVGPWQDLPAGAVVWNEPEQPHAMRTYDMPFLAIYSWPHDVNNLCRVVQAGDWGKIERELLS
ncbi:MAG: hypothetical protein HKN11_03230 [Rhizobiales bacterium]|nr:hypothetical protein [Hyphomicrobiales bacterium]